MDGSLRSDRHGERRESNSCVKSPLTVTLSNTQKEEMETIRVLLLTATDRAHTLHTSKNVLNCYMILQGMRLENYMHLKYLTFFVCIVILQFHRQSAA